jgi:predicted Zn-ribbon and HTH transcriptional regulator
MICKPMFEPKFSVKRVCRDCGHKFMDSLDLFSVLISKCPECGSRNVKTEGIHVDPWNNEYKPSVIVH